MLQSSGYKQRADVQPQEMSYVPVSKAAEGVRLQVNAVGSPEELLSSIDNVLHGNGLEQGASLQVTAGMVRHSETATLAFFDGDLSYARHVHC